MSKRNPEDAYMDGYEDAFTANYRSNYSETPELQSAYDDGHYDACFSEDYDDYDFDDFDEDYDDGFEYEDDYDYDYYDCLPGPYVESW